MEPATESQTVATLRTSFAVLRADGHYRVVATRSIAIEQVIMSFEGIMVAEPSRYSIQIGSDQHLESPPDEAREVMFDIRPWRFLNHSCAPNARVSGRNLIALRAIAPWEQISFDYNTTEYRLAAPFQCRCGETTCCGTVSGFAALAPEQRERRRPHLAPHLIAMLREEDARD
ncbi:MAG: SET domain-containing protein-lysine N-methyltransferase [Planctomycetes bacterium]|nr:SET domain-containing protein-lysine N-methyltransferase [Planctomycetota bacterium]